MNRYAVPRAPRRLTAQRAATLLLTAGTLAVVGPPFTRAGAGDAETGGPHFVAVSGSPVTEERGRSRGAAWGDFDDDGDPDLYVTRSAGDANGLYRNDRGTFLPLTATPVSRDLGDSEAAVWIDYDGDGDLDLHVVGRNGGGSVLFRNEAVGGFAVLPEAQLPGVSSASMACWADFDGDGWLDVFVVGYRSEGNRLFRNLDGTRFDEVAIPAAAAGDGEGRACAWSGRDDGGERFLAIANAARPNLVLRARPGQPLVPVVDAHLSSHAAYSYGVSWADVNNDGRQDLFIANYDDQNLLYLRRSRGAFEAAVLAGPLQGPASKGHAWADYDLDGRLDLYLGNGTPAPGMRNQLFLGAPGGFRLEAAGEFTQHADTSAGVAWADYDSDGAPDLFVANWGSEGSRNRLYRNTTRSSHWIAFDLRAEGWNTRGLGARISIRLPYSDRSRWRHRWLESTTGYAGQNQTIAHFGLGRASNVDSVRVLWPDGDRQALGAVPGGRRWTIRQGTGIEGAAPDDPVEQLLRLHHLQRVAHVLGDARSLAGSFAPTLLELNHGTVAVRSRDQLHDRFASYFASVRFLEWEDLRPPRIRLSPEGGWAELVVEKRVRTIPADTAVTKRQGHAVFAWLERWVRSHSAWRVATIASTDRPAADPTSASLADRVRAYEILRRARVALGGEDAIAEIATLRFVAECEGPRGPFRTEVASARDGRVSFVQEFPNRPRFSAGVSLTGGWHVSPDGQPVDSLDGVLGTLVTGHELHLLAIAPEARFTAPTARPTQRLDEHDADVVRFRDALGAPADFLYDAVTGRPLGFRLVNHTGRGAATVLTRFDDWRPVGEILLPFAVSITQGADLYRYRITAATTEWLTDQAFRPIAGG